MTRQNFLKNPRVITISLLVLTFLLAGVAIITAITLQRRQNVNPTPGQASECKCPEQSNIDKSKRDYQAWRDANGGATDSNWERQIREAESRCSSWKAANCQAGTDLMKCNEFTDSDNTHDPKNCAPGQVKNCAAYGNSCNGTTPVGNAQVRCSACYTPSSGEPAPTPPDSFPPTPDTNGWLAGFNCRYRTGGGKCAPSEFKGCNPSAGQICVCSGGDTQGPNGWTYANYTTKSIEGYMDCGVSCGPDDAGVGKTATKCNNPYRCPGERPTGSTPAPTPTTPPPPSCTEKCEGTSWVTRCDGNITSSTPDHPSCKSTTCTPSSKCEGRDYVTRDCNGSEKGRRKEDPRCIPTTTLKPQCIESYIETPGNKAKALGPGSEVTIYTTVLNPTNNDGWFAFYNSDNVNGVPQGAQISPLTNTAGYNTLANDQNGITGSATKGNDAAQVRTFTWKFHYDQVFNNKVDGKFNNSPLSKLQLNAYAGGMANADPNCLVYLTKTTTPPTPSPTSTPTPTPTTPPSACTGITVKNNRNNVVCNTSTNPTNCDIKQGDALTVTVAGSNTTQYRSQPSWITTQSSFTTAASSTVQVPTSALPNNRISIQGYVSNGQPNDSQGGAACLFTAQFTSTPEIDKDIDVDGSTGLVNGTSDPVIVDSNSTVKYDITVSNTGTSGILHNVIVVDSLSAYDASGTQLATAFGDIIEAEDLVRTTGTKSDPATVAPRVPTGKTYAQSANVKSVEWNKINNLYYGEVYKSKITVDVSAGTVMLRNNVCMYEDINNNGEFDYTDINDNGKYDYGVDTPTDKLLDCDSVDVSTSTPDYTIKKEAIAETSTDPVQGVKPGDKFRYAVTLKNTHESNTLNLGAVTITDTFDSEFVSKFDFVAMPTGANRTDNVITWPATADQSGSSLAPGESATYYIMVQVKSDFFDMNTECSEAVKNNVKASSTSPNYTTPVWEIYVTVGENPACAPTPVPPTETPNTGLETGDVIKYAGITLVIAAIAMYAVAGKRKRAPQFNGEMLVVNPTRKVSGLNEKLGGIISKLKDK